MKARIQDFILIFGGTLCFALSERSRQAQQVLCSQQCEHWCVACNCQEPSSSDENINRQNTVSQFVPNNMPGPACRFAVRQITVVGVSQPAGSVSVTLMQTALFLFLLYSALCHEYSLLLSLFFCLQTWCMPVMLHVQDSGMPLASDQPAVLTLLLRGTSLLCLQTKSLNVILSIQDNSVPLASHQPAVHLDSCSSLLEAFLFFHLHTCAKENADSDALDAGQWRASGQSLACGMSRLFFFLFFKAFLFF